MNLDKLNTALAKLTDWVKAGLNTKQNKVIVKISDPVNSEGKDGDICIIVDG